jgi:hypothetical protein
MMGDPWTQMDTIMAGMVIVSVSHHGEVVIAQARAPAVLIALRQRGVDRTAIIEGVNGFAMAGRICVVATSHRIHEPECPVITNPFNALSEAQREARSVRTARSLEAATCNEINDPVGANDSNSAKQEGRTQSATVFQFDAWLASGTMPKASVNKLLISFDAPLTYQQAKHRDERI